MTTRPRLVALAVTALVLLLALVFVAPARSVPEPTTAPLSGWAPVAAPRSASVSSGGAGASAAVPARAEASHLAGVSPSPLVALALAEPVQPTAAPVATPGDPGQVASAVSVGRGGSLQGLASWYRYVRGQAAAGPRLRAMLGPGWRGATVVVTYSQNLQVAVRLTDWCQCFEGTATERIIDLDSRSFAQLAPLGRGLVVVEVVIS